MNKNVLFLIMAMVIGTMAVSGYTVDHETAGIEVNESAITPRLDVDNNITDAKELVNKIILINPGNDEPKIRRVLNRTDDNILKYIRTITVHNSNHVPCSTETAIGCAPQHFSGYEIMTLDYGTIDIVYSNFWLSSSQNDKYYCGSFEFTLNHEIGHIYGGTISKEKGSSELFANEYANKHTINKGECEFPTHVGINHNK